MANLLLLACAAVAMVQVFPGTDSARVVKVTETFKYKFAIDHALVMSYTDPSQRDALLQQIFTLWKTILAQYQVTNPTIHFQQEAPALDPNSHVVQYRISGGSQQEIHLKDVTDAFEQALPRSGIQAQTLASLGIPVNTVTTNGGDNGNQGNTNGQQGQQGFQPFSITYNNAVLTYSTKDNLNQLLQHILDVWKANFGSTYPLTNLNIQVITSRPNGKGGKAVTYQITGQSSTPVDTQQIQTQFPTVLQKANLQGVQVVNIDNNSGSDTDNSDDSGDNTGKGQGFQPFQVDNNVLLTYTTQDNLNQLLQQILNLWKTTFGSTYQLTNLKITSLTSRPNGKGSRAVTYRIIGQSNTPINVQQTITQFQPKLQQAKLPGVQVVNIGGNTAGNGMGMSSNMQNNNGGMSSSMSMGMGTNGSPMAGDLTAQVTTETSVTTETPVTTEAPDNSDFVPANNGQTPSNFQIDDQVLISYTGATDRDQRLKDLLNFWKTTFASYQLTNVKIVFVKTEPSSAIYKPVYYRITGSSVQPLNVQQAITTFNNVLQQNNIPVTNVAVAKKYVNNQPQPNYNPNNNGGSSQIITVDRSGDHGGKNFQITDTILIQYTSPTDRDNFLQNQILGMWKYAVGQYSPGGVKITFLSEQPAPGSGTNFKQVTYRITGSSDQNVDSPTAVSTVHTTITNSGFSQLGVVDNSGTGSDNGGSTVNGNGGAGGGAAFQLDDSAVLTYNTPADRDAILQKLLNLFTTTFSSAQLNGVTIVFINEQPGNAGPNSHVVKFRITGQNGGPDAVAPLDQTSTQNTFDSAITSAVSSGTIPGLVAANTDVVTPAPDTGLVQPATPSGWSLSDTISLTYKTNSERDNQLKQLLVVWKKVLAQYNVGNLQIQLVNQAPGLPGHGMNAHQITYSVSGSVMPGTPTINNQVVLNSFRQSLPSYRYSWAEVVSSDQATTEGPTAVDGGTPQTPQGTGNNMNQNMNGNNINQNINNGAGPAVTIDDSVLLTYTTNAQRDALLQKLLSLFQTTYTSYQLSNLKIVYVNTSPGPGGAQQVSYRITGNTAQTPLSPTDAVKGIHEAIFNGVNLGTLSGINLVNQDDISLNDNNGGGAPFTIDDSVLLTYTSNSQRDALLQRLLKLFQTTYSSYQLTNVKIVLVNSNPAPGGAKQVSYRITGNTAQTPLNSADAVKGIHDAITNGIQQGTLSGIDLVSQGTKSGTQPFEINDNLLITYTSTQQRDQLLQTILNLFTTTFSSYQFSNTKITYKKDTAGPGASRTVYFKISGQAGQQVDVPSTISQFHTAVQNANINGGTVAVPGSTPTGTPIDITDSIVITANTRQKRDSLLQQIFALWKTVLSQYQASNLQISAVTDVAATPPTTSSGVSARLVKYHITGSSLIQFNSVDALIALFRKALQQSPIQNVFLVSDYTAASGATTESSAGSGNVGAMAGGNGGPFSIPGSVKLTYQNTQDRDTFLNQILVMWRTSIFPYQVENVAIRLTGESGTAPTKTVSYVVTGISALPIDMNEAQTTFTQTLQDSHLIGVTI